MTKRALYSCLLAAVALGYVLADETAKGAQNEQCSSYPQGNVYPGKSDPFLVGILFSLVAVNNEQFDCISTHAIDTWVLTLLQVDAVSGSIRYPEVKLKVCS